ncbi:MAG: J domain-containing protein [Chitinophagales bacterium]
MPNYTVSDYYRILEVSENATPDQIKRAYRKLAVKLHPDRNKSATAHHDFIALTEAYEYLTRYHGNSEPEYTWYQTERTEARERGTEHAEMKYETFVESEYFKNSKAALQLVEYTLFALSVVLLIGIPFWGYRIGGAQGVVATIFLYVFTAPLWGNTLIFNRPDLDWSVFEDSVKRVKATKAFPVVAGIFLNLILMFAFTFNTEISPKYLLATFAGAILLTIGIGVFALKKIRIATAPVLAVTAVNLFFTLNYCASRNPVSETYSFIHYVYLDRDTRGYYFKNEQSVIELPDGKYNDNVWFRFFFDFETIRHKEVICYHFETGLFGWRVLKGYEMLR